jgi:hypothetical protein
VDLTNHAVPLHDLFRRVVLLAMIVPQKRFPRARRLSTQMAPTLPRLPVPPLRQTLDQYLQSIKPFLLEDEARGGPSFASSFGLRVKWAQAYEKELGKTCQERLLGALYRTSKKLFTSLL